MPKKTPDQSAGLGNQKRGTPVAFWKTAAEKQAWAAALARRLRAFKRDEEFLAAERVEWLHNLTDDEARRSYFGLKLSLDEEHRPGKFSPLLRAVREAADRLIARGDFDSGQLRAHRRRRA